jgi:hypothetical protein
MGAGHGGIVAKLHQLLALFHQGSLDLPDGAIARDCVFRLNGRSYEDTLGRPASDPLVRLLGRGPAAYRFLAQGLRYAVPDLQVELDDVHGDGGLVTAVALLTGMPRGAASPLDATVDVALLLDANCRITEIGVQATDDVLRSIGTARRA